MSTPTTEAEFEFGPGAAALTAAEIAAVREAVWSMRSSGRILLVVPMACARDGWSAALADSAMDYTFIPDVHELARALAGGEVRAVVIDADCCASGGLPELATARARGGADLRCVVVASQPTRRHLVSCVAAGATDYVSRPFEVDMLVDRLVRA